MEQIKQVLLFSSNFQYLIVQIVLFQDMMSDMTDNNLYVKKFYDH